MAVAMASLILFISPLSLLLLNKLLVLDWGRASVISGKVTLGVYTLLSAGVLVAVAVTVQAQAKQTELARQRATKAMQF
jgi:hypothetical protein